MSDDGAFSNGIPLVILHLRATSIQITPPAAPLNLNAAEQFSATAWDQFGRPFSGGQLTWSLDSGSVGTINSAGLFEAGSTPGSAQVRATSGNITDDIPISVVNGAPQIVQAATAGQRQGDTLGLSVIANDDGGEAGLTYTWSTVSQPDGAQPLFLLNGVNGANATTVRLDAAGDYSFMVSVSDGGLTATSSVDVTVDPPVHPITAWYLDSNNGSDLSDGLSPGDAVKTVSALLALPLGPGDTVYAARGGKWRESLILPKGVNVAAYGSGELPLFDCSDEISAATWTKVGGRSDVYASANLPVEWVDGGKTQHVNVFENDMQMIQVADEATCDATPGSYYYAPLNATTFTLELHTSDGGNPSVDGATIEYSRRDYAVVTSGPTATAFDIWGRRNLHDDGALLMSGPTSGIEATDGGKHNIYFAPGFVESNTVAFNAYGGPGVDCSLVVVNSNVAVGEDTTFVDPIWGLDSPNANISAFFAHSNVSGEYGTLTITGGTITNVAIGVALADFASLVMTGVTTIGCAEGVVVSDGNLTDELVITDCNLSASTRAVDVTGPVNCIIEQNTITITGTTGFGIYSPGLTGSFTLLNNTITGIDAFAVGYGSSTSNTLQHNVYDTDVRFYYYGFVAGQPDDSDFNTFEFGNGSRFFVDGNILTFAQYQSLTGQDTHSINGST